MADFEPPSFSLGLDFDFDSEPQTTLREETISKQSRQCSTTASHRTIEEDDDDFESPITGPDPQVSDLPRNLKRLRRGTTSTEPAPAIQKLEHVKVRNVDDEIEEFSSQEDQRRDDVRPSTQYHSVCSISKFPLHGHGVLTTQSTSHLKAGKRKQVSNAPVSADMETSSNKLMFPKLTVSPLRRFQLIASDSDSEDSSVSEGENKEVNILESSLKEKQSNLGERATSNEPGRAKESVSMSKTEDLWKDFCSEKHFHVPTPALDEVCEEYFTSMKDKNKGRNNNSCKENINVNQDNVQQWDSCDPLPPSHNYFFHDDPRIQKLVCTRLPNFFPVGALDNRGYKQSSAPVIDYMGQFSQGEGSKKATGKNAEIESTRSRKNSKKSNAEEVSQGSGRWVNPKTCSEIPKDAGKRRVHAVGQSAGHWYMGPKGRRVYVKDGKELTGRIAYLQYKKDTGAGFKKSKKKTATKKK